MISIHINICPREISKNGLRNNYVYVGRYTNLTAIVQHFPLANAQYNFIIN